MTIGRFRHRVAFETATYADDGAGGRTATWSEAFRCPAEIRPKLGGEEVTAGRLAGRRIATIRVRAYGETRAVTTEWRARDVRTAELWNIRSIVDPDGRGAFLEVMAETGVET